MLVQIFQGSKRGIFFVPEHLCTVVPLVQTDSVLYRFVPLPTDLYRFEPPAVFILNPFFFSLLQTIDKG